MSKKTQKEIPFMSDKAVKGMPLMSLRYLDDFCKVLWLTKALKIAYRVIAKKNFEIGVLTSERDEALYELEKLKNAQQL